MKLGNIPDGAATNWIVGQLYRGDLGRNKSLGLGLLGGYGEAAPSKAKRSPPR
jgi:hypothetical protein